MEQKENLLEQLTESLFRYEGAISKAILNHYCKEMAIITGKDEAQIKKEVLDEKERIMLQHHPGQQGFDLML